MRRQRVAPRHRAERRHSPLAGAVGLRARELARRPEVVAAFSLQAMALVAAVVLAAVAAEGLAGAGNDLILGGLRVTAAPGGLLCGVLVAAVVGSEFGWATERALLARDPRRLRFAGYQLAVAAVLALAWWAVQSLLAVTVGALLQAGGGIDAGAAWNDPAHRAALAAALAATLVYGLLGAACALVLRGALAGVVALLAYGLLGELVLAPSGPRPPAGPCTPRRPAWLARAPPRCRGRPWSSPSRSRSPWPAAWPCTPAARSATDQRFSSWTAQVLPSGSSKNANRDPGVPSGPSCWIWLMPTPRPASCSRTASRSSTTSCTPLTEPGAPRGRPSPITTEQADPGGVICTTRIDSVGRASWSRLKPTCST